MGIQKVSTSGELPGEFRYDQLVLHEELGHSIVTLQDYISNYPVRRSLSCERGICGYFLNYTIGAESLQEDTRIEKEKVLFHEIWEKEEKILIPLRPQHQEETERIVAVLNLLHGKQVVRSVSLRERLELINKFDMRKSKYVFE